MGETVMVEETKEENYDELENALNPKEEITEEEVVTEDNVETSESKKEERDEVTIDPFEKLKGENADLKQTVRRQSRELSILGAKMTRVLDKFEQMSKVPKEETVSDALDLSSSVDKEVVREDKKEILSELENIQNEITSVGERRGDSLNDMLEIMSLNENYKDIKEVCTRARFDDIFEGAASDYVKKEGGDLLTAQMKMELEVWKMSNPYKYMYGIIKKYHPDYVDKDKTASPGIKGPKPTEEALNRGKTPAKAPTSALDMSTGGDVKSSQTWTAEKIDAMDESELHKIPDAVYQEYLAGNLDKKD